MQNFTFNWKKHLVDTERQKRPKSVQKEIQPHKLNPMSETFFSDLNTETLKKLGFLKSTKQLTTLFIILRCSKNNHISPRLLALREWSRRVWLLPDISAACLPVAQQSTCTVQVLQDKMQCIVFLLWTRTWIHARNTYHPKNEEGIKIYKCR